MTILLGLLPGRWVMLMVFLQPMLTVCFFPAGFTILSRIVPPSARNLSVSLTMFIAYLIGAGFLPTLLGIFGDRGAFGTAFILVGSLMLLSVLLLPRLVLTEGKETERDLRDTAQSNHPRKETEAVAHLPADQGLPLQLDQMDIGLVEGEEAVERGNDPPRR